jgi:O-acetyl-ADP-ribose deacetylase (regulator of RNase III)
MSIFLKNVGDDLFGSGAEAIVNPVNCVGVMGKGLALVFKNRFPDNFSEYQYVCGRALLRPGGIHVHQVQHAQRSDHTLQTTAAMQSKPEWIVNVATKDHWRNESKSEWIVEAVSALRRWADEHGIRSIACPALGAGLGNLRWEEVQKILEEGFSTARATLLLYPPHAVENKNTIVRNEKVNHENVGEDPYGGDIEKNSPSGKLVANLETNLQTPLQNKPARGGFKTLSKKRG